MTVSLNNVQVQDNPAPFTSDFKFLITFDCVEPGLKEELEWKLIYVGSADCEDNDQELDSILVGPVRVGKNRFTFEVMPWHNLHLRTLYELRTRYKMDEMGHEATAQSVAALGVLR